MRTCKILIIVLFLFPSAQLMSQGVEVTGICYSDFDDEILPEMVRPAVILFGSNYCGYSRNQLKLLKQTLSQKQYLGKYIDFYSVNVDTRVDSDWLENIYDEDDDERGTPTWVFYYIDEEGDVDYYYLAGNMNQNDMVYYFEDLVWRSWFITSHGITKKYCYRD